MEKIYYIFAVVAIVLMLIWFSNRSTEKFADVPTPSEETAEINKLSKQTDETIADYHPGIKIPPDDRDSDIYKDLKKYENTLVDNEVSELGIDKCLKDADCTCVEFGYTGIAYCFPKKIY